MAEPPVAVRRARSTDAPALIAILTRAFEGDPFVEWTIGGRGPKARRRYVELVVRRLTLPHGECWLDAQGRGAALWAPPGAWETTLGAQLAMLPAVLRVVGLRRMMTVATAAERIEAGRPPPPWYYLALLGTRPEARRRGVASALLRAVTRRCDDEHVPALLETSVPANTEFYRRFGFEVTREIALPEDGPAVWAMRRDPA